MVCPTIPEEAHEEEKSGDGGGAGSWVPAHIRGVGEVKLFTPLRGVEQLVTDREKLIRYLTIYPKSLADARGIFDQYVSRAPSARSGYPEPAFIYYIASTGNTNLLREAFNAKGFA